MLSYVDSVYIAALLNFFTILCFCGLHEVARELENPFTNEPNDIPLVTFQSQFNEALLSMYAGYHPDSWYVFMNTVIFKNILFCILICKNFLFKCLGGKCHALQVQVKVIQYDLMIRQKFTKVFYLLSFKLDV